MTWDQDTWGRDAGRILEPHQACPESWTQSKHNHSWALVRVDEMPWLLSFLYPPICLPVPPTGKTVVEANWPQSVGKADGCLSPGNEELETNTEEEEGQTDPEEQRLQPH